MIVLLISVFLLLIFMEMPIAFALGIATLAALAFSGYDFLIFFHRMLNSLSSFSLIAVPLYVLAGNLCSETGITKRLVRMCNTLVGHIHGGTGLVNVLASIFFGGISGSAVADSSAIGGMLIPIMEQEGYDKEFAGGITMASSTIGILIPPSIPQCLYGICAGVSIGALFMAGFLPGILVGIFQMIMCYYLSKKRNYPKLPKSSNKERLKATIDAGWGLGMPLIIMIGCGCGIVTASEAGVLAVVYSVIIGLFVYRELSMKKLPEILINSVVTSAVALFIVGVASVVSWSINVANLPRNLTLYLTDSINNKFLILLIINLVLFICGCFMDLVPVMLLFAPIFLPIIKKLGVDPVTFGVSMTINLGIGLLTPPVGNCLFIVSGISKTGTIKLFKAALPFIFCNITILIFVYVFPQLTTWLPSIMGY